MVIHTLNVKYTSRALQKDNIQVETFRLKLINIAWHQLVWNKEGVVLKYVC